MTAAGGRAVAGDGVGLWWRLDGAGPTVLLVPGRGDSTDVFPPDLSDALIAAGCSVLRYDPRDTGLTDDGGSYTLADMARDIVVVADAAGVERLHVVALSMGGMVVVDLAVDDPARVASLVFLSAMSPDPHAGMGPRFLDGVGADPVQGTLASMGTATPADEVWMRARVETAIRRAPARPDAAHCHQRAALRLGWPDLAALGRITAGTLVVHGARDLVLPMAHADAYARGVPGARLVVLDELGHLPTQREWAVIADLVADHVMATADPAA